jgi:hypothetical protein
VRHSPNAVLQKRHRILRAKKSRENVDEIDPRSLKRSFSAKKVESKTSSTKKDAHKTFVQKNVGKID